MDGSDRTHRKQIFLVCTYILITCPIENRRLTCSLSTSPTWWVGEVHLKIGILIGAVEWMRVEMGNGVCGVSSAGSGRDQTLLDRIPSSTVCLPKGY